MATKRKTATTHHRVIRNPDPETAEDKRSTPRAIADRGVLRLLRLRGAELVRVRQAREIEGYDQSAEDRADAFAEALDVIAVERAATRIDIENARRGDPR